MPLASEADQDHADSAPPRPSTPNVGRHHAMATGGTLTIHPDGQSYTYAYGPKGLAGLWFNNYALACAIWASIGGLTFGYDQGVIANILVMKDFTHRFPVGAWEKGLLSKHLSPCPIELFHMNVFVTFSCNVGAWLPCWGAHCRSLCRLLLKEAIDNHCLL